MVDPQQCFGPGDELRLSIPVHVSNLLGVEWGRIWFRLLFFGSQLNWNGTHAPHSDPFLCRATFHLQHMNHVIAVVF